MKEYMIGPFLGIMLSLILGCGAQEENIHKGEINYWKGDTFIQPNIDVSEYEAGIIRAKVDGKWQKFEIRSLPDGFMEWRISSSIKGLEDMRKGKMPGISGGGSHFGAVATYGGHRLDTEFSINNAFKGIGVVPKKEKIKEAIKKLESTWDSSMEEKLGVLKGFYEEKDFRDRTKLTSLELYTRKDFETHTFLNIMANPSVSIVFLDIPSYEVRAICQLVHPKDKTASEEEKDILKYVNLVHDYFHGKSPRQSICMIFHVNQVFDNSPRAKGVRVTP